MKNFIQNILAGDVVIQLFGATYIQRKSLYFAHHFTILCSLPIVLRTCGDEFYDKVAIVMLVGHVAEVVAKLDFCLPSFPRIDDRVCIVT